MTPAPLSLLEFTVLVTCLSLIIWIIIAVIISTATDWRMDPIHYAPLVPNMIEWTAVLILSFINLSMWVKVIARWLS